MTKEPKTPSPTIERLALYSRPLKALMDSGTLLISSEKLAESCGVNSAQVRKDLAYFGEFGVRGVGYDVRDLLLEIRKILATDREWPICIVGVGNLGSALVQNDNFKKRGYNFVAAFDSDPEKVGGGFPGGLIIEPISKIMETVKALHIEIGLITTPAFEAQRMANLLMDAGVKAVLNFAPIQVRAPEGCIVENVDLTVTLEDLAYHLGNIT